MAPRAHPTQDAGYFHIMNRSADRRVLFTQPADYRAFLDILREALARHPVRLIAYSVMPDHWRLVVGPTVSKPLTTCLQWVITTHAAWFRHSRDIPGDRPVYQACTSVALPGIGDLVRVCRDVERNALLAHLVRRAQDWPWCSLSARVHPSGTLPLVDAPFLSSRAWADYVNARWPPDQVTSHLPSRASRLDDVAQPPGFFA